jgi:hypothetical protein
MFWANRHGPQLIEPGLDGSCPGNSRAVVLKVGVVTLALGTGRADR